MKKGMDKLIGAQCVFCGYAGNRYWSAYSHDEHCPFYRVSGKSNRKKAFRNAIRKQSILLEGLRDSSEMIAVGAEVICV